MTLTSNITINDIQQKIDLKTKPLGALGQLETLAKQIATVQNTLTPKLTKPTLFVFAGDHGIANEGVSAYPQEVTYQMVMNFLAGGAGINVFSRQHGIKLQIVDAGVNYAFDYQDDLVKNQLINQKMANGTQSFLSAPAMSDAEFEQCLTHGKTLVEKAHKQGSNIIGFGEMGIGNTSSASMLMSYLCDLPITDCVGRGTGVDDDKLAYKLAILTQAKAHHGNISDPKKIGATFAGFEIAQMCGAMLAGYEHGMLLMVDGFIASSAFLLAQAINPDIKANAIFCHQSDESGHKTMLDFLGATPLLSLNLRLGEGTGCALAYPIIESAVAFFNDMASFDSAGVSNK